MLSGLALQRQRKHSEQHGAHAETLLCCHCGTADLYGRALVRKAAAAFEKEERRQRVEKIKSETTDAVTRAAKKAFVDERWDIADNQRCVLRSKSVLRPMWQC